MNQKELKKTTQDRPLRILIVDDNEQSCYLLHILLEGHGHAVVTASNGAEALDLARQDPPDMVISDILMPVMDGFTLCREWKGDDRLKEIPFVFYTATYTDPRDEELALSLGADRFIIKPVEPDLFVALLQEVIEEHEAGRLTPPQEPAAAEETVYLEMYNQALIRKLEDKMLQLEEANQALKQQAQELARQRDQLQLLHRVDRVIGTALSLAELLDQLTAELARGLGFNHCTVWLLDAAGGFLRGRGHTTKPGELDVARIRLPRNDPLVVRLFKSRQLVIAPDVTDPAHTGVVSDEYVTVFHLQAVLAVPLIVREEIIGFLVLGDTFSPRVFQPEEIELVQGIATQAAIAIQNARLHEQVQRHADELEERVRKRTRDLNILVDAMAGREVRMAELKDVIRQLRAQLIDAGLTPVADDPLAPYYPPVDEA